MNPRRARPRLLLPTLVFVVAMLAGCATRPPPQPTAPLLHDAMFEPPAVPVDASTVFALSEPMQRYAAASLQGRALQSDPRQALLDALYQRSALRLSYDASRTRNAAEAFDARAGNCLSLVIMTAAFAKHLGLPVSYQSVLVDELYTRAGDLMLASGHVNLVLERLSPRTIYASSRLGDPLTVDFLPPSELRGTRTQPLEERTIVAMFMNNRAAEALTNQQLPDAYAWAREAVLQDPGFLPAVNTLAVIYLRAGHPGEAETALRHVLAREPDDIPALTNLRSLMLRAARNDEADAVAQRLAALQPVPPFHWFELGRQAMDAGDYATARDLFQRELKRQPYQHEVHYWAAQAWYRLGRPDRAAEHLKLAIDNSITLSSQALYSAKLGWLRAHHVQ